MQTMNEKVIDKVMTASAEDFADREFVTKHLLPGNETSRWHNAVLEVLRIRRLVEEMRASKASSNAAVKIIRLTWVNAFLTLFIVLVTACGVGWNIWSDQRQGTLIDQRTGVVGPPAPLVSDVTASVRVNGSE